MIKTERIIKGGVILTNFNITNNYAVQIIIEIQEIRVLKTQDI